MMNKQQTELKIAIIAKKEFWTWFEAGEQT